MIRVLDLFSGIGGFSLGLRWAGGFETVGFCEIDPFCQKVLRKHWPDVQIEKDIHDVTADTYSHPIDLICGGFPCQPFSVAGNKRGREDDRDLWPQMFKVIQAYQPRWVVGENVAGFLNMEFERTALNLESEGYEVRAFVLPAASVNAPHLRERVWIVAHSHRERCSQSQADRESNSQNGESSSLLSRQTPMAHPCNERCEEHHDPPFASEKEIWGSDFGNRQVPAWAGGSWAEPEATIRRVSDGLPRRLDSPARRVKALGNAVVPQVVMQIGRAIRAVEAELAKEKER